MNRLKNLLVLLLLLLFSVMLTACDVKDIFSAKDVEQIDPVELSFYYPRDGSGAFHKSIAAFNNTNPDFIIKGEEGGRTKDYLQNLIAAYAAGENVPDIVMLHDTWYPYFAAEDFVMQLNDKFPEDSINEFIPGMISAVTVDNKVYGLPLWADTILLYYRKDLVKDPPKTWSQLKSDAITIADKNKRIEYPVLLPGNNSENSAYFLYNLMSGYGTGLNLRSNKVKLNNDNGQKSFEMLRDLIDDDVLSKDIFGLDPEGCRVQFERGKALFMFNWSYARKLLGQDEDSPIKGKVGVAKLPVGSSDKGNSIISGWAVSVSKGTKNENEALRFISYLGGSESQMRMVSEGGLMPARLNLYDQTDWKKSQKVTKVLETSLLGGRPMLVGNNIEKHYESMSAALQQAFKESDNKPKDILNDMIRSFKNEDKDKDEESGN